jgi:hypothetical protein
MQDQNPVSLHPHTNAGALFPMAPPVVAAPLLPAPAPAVNSSNKLSYVLLPLARTIVIVANIGLSFCLIESIIYPAAPLTHFIAHYLPAGKHIVTVECLLLTNLAALRKVHTLFLKLVENSHYPFITYTALPFCLISTFFAVKLIAASYDVLTGHSPAVPPYILLPLIPLTYVLGTQFLLEKMHV